MNVLALVGVAGCSGLVDLSGLTGATASPDAASSEDAGGAESGTLDTGPDSMPPRPTGDASTAEAAAPDGAVPADAADVADGGTAPLSFCSALTTPHRICDDFDQPTFGSQWTIMQGGGGSITRAVSSASPPFGAFITLPSPCNNAYGQLLDDANAKPDTVRLQFAVNVHRAPAAVGVHLAGIFYETGPGKYYRVDIAYRTDRLNLFENDSGSFSSVAASLTMPTGKLVALDIELRFFGTKTATVKVDGVTHLSGPLLAPEPSVALTRLEVGGFAYQNCSDKTEITIDNLVYALTAR